MSMTQHDPRIVVRHLGGRTWTAQPIGRGAGVGWGCALAELDHLAETHTQATPPTYYLDDDRMRRLRIRCHEFGVRIETADGASLPTARVR